jgi:magnesium-protoporphyrin IX monomethyl ester (oxidative) cyclase
MWYKEMAGLLPLLYHLYPPFGSITIRYQRFSHYHERQKEYGLNFCFPELMRSVYPLPPEDLLGLTYEFDEAHRKNLRENPLLATLLARPGLGALEPAVAAWISVFWSKDQPMLGMTVTGGELVIRDTRPVAVAPSFRLSGLERDLYLACEHAQPPNALCKTFAAGRTTQEDVDSALQSLVDRKLMVRVDGRALALAVREPCEPLLAPHKFPGGCLKKVR